VVCWPLLSGRRGPKALEGRVMADVGLIVLTIALIGVLALIVKGVERL
jgi:hypothetical protein